MKKVAILGSTGSIGTQALDVINMLEDLTVVALSAGENIALLEQQMRQFHPQVVAVKEKEAALRLQEQTKDLAIPIVYGMDGLIQVATCKESDIVLTAIVGMLGIQPTIAAIQAGKNIALANKETLVCAGHIIMPLAKRMGVSIYPVDSEHSAIFQCLQGRGKNAIRKLWITASGGPFRGMSSEQLQHVSLQDALAHPNWSMGKKITIDSATMVNKGLEIIEAKWLFHVELKDISVVVHPQSVIHSAVEYEDGAVIAQLGTPDMRLPIQYALLYPERRELANERLDFSKLGSMTFEEPDEEVFYGLKLAKQALMQGGNMPTILNAANEMAVGLFLEERITFCDIPKIIEDCMKHISFIDCPSVDEIFQTQRQTQEYIKGRWIC